MKSPLGALIAFGLGIATALVAVTEKQPSSTPSPVSANNPDDDVSRLVERIRAASRKRPNITLRPAAREAEPQQQQTRSPAPSPRVPLQDVDACRPAGPGASQKNYVELSWKKFRSEHPDLVLSQAVEERRRLLSGEKLFLLQGKLEKIIDGDPPRCAVVGTFGPVQEWRFAGDWRIYARNSLHSERGIEVLLIGDKGSQDKDCERLRALH